MITLTERVTMGSFVRCDAVYKKPCFHDILSCILTTMTWLTSGESHNFDSCLSETANFLKMNSSLKK